MGGQIERQLPEEVRRSVDEAWPVFVEFLKKRDARITQARRIVLAEVFMRHDHFCAEDLANGLSSGPNHVSRGTVYRTLSLMEEAGLVRVIRDTDVHTRYEHTFNHPQHEHMVCDQCGTFIEFEDAVIAERIAAACAMHSFDIRTHRIVVFGTCRECRVAAPPKGGGNA